MIAGRINTPEQQHENSNTRTERSVSMDFRIISLGTLAANPLWGERTAVRTGHTTTVLITTGTKANTRHILVDPGLPGPAIVARLAERAHLEPADITDVFLTSFNPDARRGLASFERADWWIGEQERESVGVAMAQQLKLLATRQDNFGNDRGGVGEGVGGEGFKAILETDINILRKCNAAPEELAERVGLFPMPGVTPGLCGLLLEGSRFTTVICGDAIPTEEHLLQGKVLPSAADSEVAKRSFEEAIEVADLLVLGRDNVVVNPTKRPF
jgi:glyoxylase-like metal-dependent hydrolase (beta-lactamase superfamily II)